jgi:branched-chain amino acid transport system permease protein
MGLNILTGYNGQISLGHGALVALGAYTAAILLDDTKQLSFVDATPWPFWLTIIFSGVLTAVVGLFVGIPALRLSGPYLAIATLALAISFPNVARKYDGLTEGSAGIRPPPLQTPGFLDGVLERGEYLYFLSLFIAVVMLLVAWAILRGPLGRAFVAVRDSEVAAEAVGINIARTKVTAFTISAFYAGIAGGLYMQVVGFVSPDAISIFQSINVLAAIVIGGLATIVGSVIGGAAMIFLPSDGPRLVVQIPFIDALFNIDDIRRSPGAIQGAIVVVTIILLPTGIAGGLERLRRLQPTAVMDAVRAAPARAMERASGAREQLGRLQGVGRRGEADPDNDNGVS